MGSTESDAAKMRHLVEDAQLVPNDAGLALADLVVSTRPWANERVVAVALRSWAERYTHAGTIDSGLQDGASDVAAEMRLIGRWADPPSNADMIGITFHMLHNVAVGRGATEYDLLRDHLVGVPERTLRRYRQRVRDAGGNVGVEPLHDFMASLQYDIDVAALVHQGRTPAAARRWLERHPGKHAKDAPPPRQRRG